MPQPLKTFFNWSTGKDSALALYHLKRDKRYSVERLLTSVNAAHDRVSMHGLRRELMEKQAAATGLPVTTIELSEMPEMAEYEEKIGKAVNDFKTQAFDCSAFGDIFLEDLRRYREDKLAAAGLKAVFPLWKRDTRELMHEFLDLGFKAITVSVNAEKLGEEFVGRELDASFLADLPNDVDPCGENGEFHTFCFAGPVFTNSIPFSVGEKVFREYNSPSAADKKAGYWFCDLKPGFSTQSH